MPRGTPNEIMVKFADGTVFNSDRTYRARLIDTQRKIYEVDLALNGNGERGRRRPTGEYTPPEERDVSRRVAEEIVVTLPYARKASEPRWRKYSLIPLGKDCVEFVNCRAEYSNSSEFLGGYRHKVAFNIDRGRRQPETIETWVTNAPDGTPEGAPVGGYISAGLRVFFDAHRNLRPGDKVHIRRMGRDNYNVWVEKQRGRPRSG